MSLSHTETQLDPWEPCKQCIIVNVDQDDEKQYSGVNDNKYLECDKCSEWIHPTCDDIAHEIAEKIDIYYCMKCRARTRKITYRRDQPKSKENIVLAPPKLEVHYSKNEATTTINIEKPKHKPKIINKNKPKQKAVKKPMAEEPLHITNTEIAEQNNIATNVVSQDDENAIMPTSDELLNKSQEEANPNTINGYLEQNNSMIDETLSQYMQLIPAAQVKTVEESGVDNINEEEETISQFIQQIPGGQEKDTEDNSEKNCEYNDISNTEGSPSQQTHVMSEMSTEHTQIDGLENSIQILQIESPFRSNSENEESTKDHETSTCHDSSIDQKSDSEKSQLDTLSEDEVDDELKLQIPKQTESMPNSQTVLNEEIESSDRVATEDEQKTDELMHKEEDIEKLKSPKKQRKKGTKSKQSRIEEKMPKKKLKKKKLAEEIKNHQLQDKNKQEIIVEYIALEKMLSQKQAEISESREEIQLLQPFREKYLMTMKVLDEQSKQNGNETEKNIATLQKRLIEHEESSKEQMKKIVDLKISATAKQIEIRKLKEAANKNLSKLNDLEGIREQTQGRISRTDELLNVKTNQIESLEKIIETKNLEIDYMKNQGKARDNEISRLEDQLKSMEKINKDLNHELEIVSENIIKNITEPNGEAEIVNISKEGNKICSYYKMGQCKVINCKYSHEDETSQTTTNQDKSKLPCVFYQLGQCKAKNCKFSHEKSKPDVRPDKSQANQRGQSSHMQNGKKSKIPCRFHSKGRCNLGSQCSFSHSDTSSNKSKSETPCLYFQNGYCKWNENCQYLHQVKDDWSVVKRKINRREEICFDFLRGKCSKGNFCHKSHPDKSNRCSDFDQGFCERKSRCHKTHMPDRPTINKFKRTEAVKQNVAHVETNSPTVPVNPAQRCNDFDNGFCPKRGNCPLKHAKDRISSTENANQDEGMKNSSQLQTHRL